MASVRRAVVGMGWALLAACASSELPPAREDLPSLTAQECVPTSCAVEGRTCGQISDGCGRVMECGACPSGEACGAGGAPNRCGTGTCAAHTCATAGKNCGQISDGCSAVLTCGSCLSP